jgi:hypothetical protein
MGTKKVSFSGTSCNVVLLREASSTESTIHKVTRQYTAFIGYTVFCALGRLFLWNIGSDISHKYLLATVL